MRTDQDGFRNSSRHKLKYKNY